MLTEMKTILACMFIGLPLWIAILSVIHDVIREKDEYVIKSFYIVLIASSCLIMIMAMLNCLVT